MMYAYAYDDVLASMCCAIYIFRVRICSYQYYYYYYYYYYAYYYH